MSPTLPVACAVVLLLKSLCLANGQAVASSSDDFSNACEDEHGRCSSIQEPQDLGSMKTALLQIKAVPSETHSVVAENSGTTQIAALSQDRGRLRHLTIDDLLHRELPENSSLPLPVPYEHASVQFNSEMYMAVANKTSNKQMAAFIERLVDKIGGIIVDHKRFLMFVPYYSGQTSVQNFAKLLVEIRDAGHVKDGWLKLPPPEKGPILWNMIRSDPWVCDLLLDTDPRRSTCSLEVDAKELEPASLTCGAEDTCNTEHANSYRALYDIGSLPCCSTPPFCSAPLCSTEQQDKKATCTKRTATENLAYMKDPDIWPAYHGNGGSFELDVSKYMDLFASPPDSDNSSQAAFDLVFDLGANTGYYTEKMTTRSFGKNYVMVEANPVTEELLVQRWGDTEWKNRWFSEQTTKQGLPDFEIIPAALSNHSKGVVNMCETESSFEYAKEGCEAHITSLDRLVTKKLSPTFQGHLKEAQTAFIKIDTEGMDELVLRGMQGLLEETRGKHADGSKRYLVNFLQFEFSPALMKKAKDREHFHAYDIKTATKFLETLGFESFLIGPRFLPLSHGSWDDEFMTFTSDTANNAGVRMNYPHFDDRICRYCTTSEGTTFTSDIFVVRTSHPRSTELKKALGACKESKDFHLKDPQYMY